MKKKTTFVLICILATMLAGCSGKRAVEETVEEEVVTTIEVKMADEKDLETAIKNALDSKNMLVETYDGDTLVATSYTNYVDGVEISYAEANDASTALYIKDGSEVCTDLAIKVSAELMTDDDVNAAIAWLSAVSEEDTNGTAVKTTLEEFLGEKLTTKMSVGSFESDVVLEIKNQVYDWYFTKKAEDTPELFYEDGILHELGKSIVPKELVKTTMDSNPFLFDSKNVTIVNQEVSTVDGVEYAIATIKLSSHGEEVEALFYINGDDTEKITIGYSNGQRVVAYPGKCEVAGIPAYFDNLEAVDMTAALENAEEGVEGAVLDLFDLEQFAPFLEDLK